jgi:hypothetical protein
VDDQRAAIYVDGPSVLKVACPPPGIGAKKVQEISETKFRTAYFVSAVALKSAVINLDFNSTGISGSANSSALEVACPPPGIGAKVFQIVLLAEHVRMELESSANRS